MDMESNYHNARLLDYAFANKNSEARRRLIWIIVKEYVISFEIGASFKNRSASLTSFERSSVKCDVSLTDPVRRRGRGRQSVRSVMFPLQPKRSQT